MAPSCRKCTKEIENKDTLYEFNLIDDSRKIQSEDPFIFCEDCFLAFFGDSIKFEIHRSKGLNCHFCETKEIFCFPYGWFYKDNPEVSTLLEKRRICGQCFKTQLAPFLYKTLSEVSQ